MATAKTELNPFAPIDKLHKIAIEKTLKYDDSSIRPLLMMYHCNEQFDIRFNNDGSVNVTDKVTIGVTEAYRDIDMHQEMPSILPDIPECRGIEIQNQQQKDHKIQPKSNHPLMVPSNLPPPPLPPIDARINGYLIYFKILEQKIDSQLDESKDLSKFNLQKLQTLKEDLEDFLPKLEQLYHEEDIGANPDIEDNPHFKEILACVNKLTDIFNLLEESQIPDILKSDVVKPSCDQYLASILGLEEEVVEFLSNCDDHFFVGQEES